jgi:hypothetical protein
MLIGSLLYDTEIQYWGRSLDRSERPFPVQIPRRGEGWEPVADIKPDPASLPAEPAHNISSSDKISWVEAALPTLCTAPIPIPARPGDNRTSGGLCRALKLPVGRGPSVWEPGKW